MREILFRGKRLDNGEWIEGHLLTVTLLEETAYLIFADSFKIVCGEVKASLHALVDPDTIGQYTGLTDKNGKRIFEGDLLDGFQYPFFREESHVHNYFAEVVWFDDSPAFGLVTHKHPLSAVRGISAGNAEYMEEFDPNDWEVIGNIHDNPELLEGGADG